MERGRRDAVSFFFYERTYIRHAGTSYVRCVRLIRTSCAGHTYVMRTRDKRLFLSRREKCLKRRFLTHFEKNMQKSDFFLHFLYYYSSIAKIIKKNYKKVIKKFAHIKKMYYLCSVKLKRYFNFMQKSTMLNR